jgi:hypothetical protein
MTSQIGAKMNRRSTSKLLVLLFSGSWLIAAPGYADCEAPKAPDAPEATSATKEQMIEAMKAFKQYNTDVDTYVACLGAETKTKAADGSIPPGQIMQFKSLQNRKQAAAADERKSKVDNFNEQVRKFKAQS